MGLIRYTLPFGVGGDDVNGPIALAAHRLAAGSGVTQISSGIPLGIGQLMPGVVSGVGLWRNGVEVACNITALTGTYYDGSVVSLLVQYQTPESLTQNDNDTTGGSAGSATYELRLTGSVVGRVSQDPSWIKDIPDGFFRPTPTHFKKNVVGVYGPLLPLSETTGDWANIDVRYLFSENYQWVTLGRTTTGTGTNVSSGLSGPIETANGPSWYDQPATRLQYFFRGGPAKFLDRGLKQAAVVKNYYAANAEFGNWHKHDVRCLGMGYWLTGVAAYRTRAIFMAQNNTNSYMDPRPSQGGPGEDDGRIIGRQMGWLLQSWLLGDTATSYGAGTNAVTQLDGYVTFCVSSQQGDGSWHQGYNNVPGSDNFQSNFMQGVRAMYLSLYNRYRGPSKVNIAATVAANRTFMDTQYTGTYQTWHYWSDWVNGDNPATGVPPGGQGGMRQLALLCMGVNLLDYELNNNAAALTNLTAVLQMHYAQTPSGDVLFTDANYGLKPHTEDHYTYQYFMAATDWH